MTLVRRYTLLLAAVLVVIWTVAFQWEWSFIDDVGLKTTVNQLMDGEGIAGLWTGIRALASSDRSWGLFRPLWYVYATIFYLANPAVAHGIRLAMLFAVVLIPALRFGRYPLAAVVAATVLAANVTLYLGLSYLSLQELSGLTLVTLGLLSDGPIRRSLLWLGAAWFKTPFIWLFLAWSVYLLFQRKKWAWLNVLAGVFTIVMAASASRKGTYTQGFDLANVVRAIKTAIPLFFWPGLVGLAGVIALRPRLKTLAWRSPLAWVFLVGGALYLGNLLPWGQAGSYYGAPAIWLLSVGALLILLPAERADFRYAKPVTIAATVFALAGSLHVARKMTTQQVNRNAAVVGVREWARNVPPAETIAINSEEGAVRLAELLALHGAPHPVKFVPDGDAVEQPKYYVFFHDQSGGNPRLQKTVVRRMTMATIYSTS